MTDVIVDKSKTHPYSRTQILVENAEDNHSFFFLQGIEYYWFIFDVPNSRVFLAATTAINNQDKVDQNLISHLSLKQNEYVIYMWQYTELHSGYFEDDFISSFQNVCAWCSPSVIKHLKKEELVTLALHWIKVHYNIYHNCGSW